jgi:glycosyltransferase involved in cell wall biosynthesis
MFFGRYVRESPAGPDALEEVELPADVELVPLPDYSSLGRPLEVGRATFGTITGMWRGLSQVDVVWAWGPHPFSVVLAAFSLLRRKRVALCVRQDTLEYHRRRLTSRRWLPALGVIWSIEAVYRLLARRLPTTAVGTGVARRYGTGSNVLPMAISLMRAADVVPSPPNRDWGGEISLLTVGRIEPEKNPLLIVEALGRLEAAWPNRFKLVWVGRGQLEDDVRRRAEELGVGDRIELRGYVPFGPELLAFYRQAHAFVHVSLTEGLPQVLIEAMAAGLPIVATDVGGVSNALDHGRAGVLVPPSDVEALVGSIERISEDDALRERMVTHGLDVARRLTIESQAAQVARFILDG